MSSFTTIGSPEVDRSAQWKSSTSPTELCSLFRFGIPNFRQSLSLAIALTQEVERHYRVSTPEWNLIKKSVKFMKECVGNPWTDSMRIRIETLSTELHRMAVALGMRGQFSSESENVARHICNGLSVLLQRNSEGAETLIRGSSRLLRPSVVSSMIKDIFVNPFLTITFNSSWRTPTVIALADGVLADKGFDRLPILADALEDAGCDNAEILVHLRGNERHYQGCWSLDVIAGTNKKFDPLESKSS